MAPTLTPLWFIIFTNKSYGLLKTCAIKIIGYRPPNKKASHRTETQNVWMKTYCIHTVFNQILKYNKGFVYIKPIPSASKQPFPQNTHYLFRISERRCALGDLQEFSAAWAPWITTCCFADQFFHAWVAADSALYLSLDGFPDKGNTKNVRH